MLQTASTLPVAPRRATSGSRQFVAALMALMVTAPLLLMPLARPQAAQAQIPNPLKNMSTKKKVVLVAGAALLYYLYRRHQAGKEAQAAQNAPTSAAPAQAANRRPQLYRSKNGGVYYRDANGKPVWLTVPNRAVQVSQDDLNRYAPNYQQYQGQRAPSAPSGYRTQQFSDFDPSLMNGTSGGSMVAPGPRGRM